MSRPHPATPFAFSAPSHLHPFFSTAQSTLRTSSFCSSPVTRTLLAPATIKHSSPPLSLPLRRPCDLHHRRHDPSCITGAEFPEVVPSVPASPVPPSSPGLADADDTNVDSSSTAAALIKFTRPHTIRGTIIGSIAGCARALLESPVAIDWSLLPRAGLGMVALLLGNAFIVGINQIYDVRIDRINKPFLPLAAKQLSFRTAWMICALSAIFGLFIVRAFFSRLIFGLYAFGMCFGALYSIPPFRFKRSPLLAAVTISSVRGFLMNFGVYHATKSALQVPFAWSPPITFLAIFMTIFATVIALSKDLPDIEGDSTEGVPTFAARVGPHRMVAIVYAMLAFNYVGAILTAGLAPAGVFNRTAMGVGHICLAVWLISHMTGVQPGSQESIKKFYRFIWKLFYAEYLLFPFI